VLSDCQSTRDVGASVVRPRFPLSSINIATGTHTHLHHHFTQRLVALTSPSPAPKSHNQVLVLIAQHGRRCRRESVEYCPAAQEAAPVVDTQLRHTRRLLHRRHRRLLDFQEATTAVRVRHITWTAQTPVANRRRYIHLQEEYIKDEQRSLKRELVRAQEEIKRIQSVPLVIGQFMEAIDQK
jgi:hypothetical protein